MNTVVRLARKMEESIWPQTPEPLVENRPGYWLAMAVGLWLLGAGFGCLALGLLLTVYTIFLRSPVNLELVRQLTLLLALLLITVGAPVVSWAGSLSRLRIAVEDLEAKK